MTAALGKNAADSYMAQEQSQICKLLGETCPIARPRRLYAGGGLLARLIRLQLVRSATPERSLR